MMAMKQMSKTSFLRDAAQGLSPGRLRRPLLLLAFALFPGTLLAISNEEKAVMNVWLPWVLAAFPLLIGLVFQLITLAVIGNFIRDCLKKGSYSRMSGFSLAGPIFINFGLALGPDGIPLWVYLLPWEIEFLATAVAILVRRKTRAIPEPPPVRTGPA